MVDYTLVQKQNRQLAEKLYNIAKNIFSFNFQSKDGSLNVIEFKNKIVGHLVELYKHLLLMYVTRTLDRLPLETPSSGSMPV